MFQIKTMSVSSTPSVVMIDLHFHVNRLKLLIKNIRQTYKLEDDPKEETDKSQATIRLEFFAGIIQHDINFEIRTWDDKKYLQISYALHAAELIFCELIPVLDQLEIIITPCEIKDLLKINCSQQNLSNIINYMVSKLSDDDIDNKYMTILCTQIIPALEENDKKFNVCEFAIRTLITKSFLDCAEAILPHIDYNDAVAGLETLINETRAHKILNAIDPNNPNDKRDRILAALPFLIRGRSELAHNLALELVGYDFGHELKDLFGNAVDLGKNDIETHIQLLLLLGEAKKKAMLTPAFSLIKSSSISTEQSVVGIRRTIRRTNSVNSYLSSKKF